MTDITKEAQVLKRYREVVALAGGLENHILAKSSLYQRLKEGKQPLVLPPPLNHSYPWYSTVESDAPVGLPFGPADWCPDWDKRHGIAICQDVWTKVDGDLTSDLTVTYPGWADLGFVWRVWQSDEPAGTTSATLCCWHRNEVRGLTTPELVEAECRWRVERLTRWVVLAGEKTKEELQALYIASGEAGDPGEKVTDIVASLAVSQFRHFAEERTTEGLSLILTQEEIEAKVAADITSLLGDDWLVRDGELLHRCWKIQRISPPSLGPEHYLEPI